MNFYGHAVFASRLRSDHGYALGSMLPDFEGMCGSRLVSTSSDSVRDGIALHHATDSAFHGAPEFLGLCASGLAALTSVGVRRATARACAHVGTELVFDSYLIETYGEDASYIQALDAAAPDDAVGSSLVFPDGGLRFEGLRRRLRAFGVPSAYRESEFVADRLVGALAGRPRLAMREGDRALVASWLVSAAHEIRSAAPAIADRVSAALQRAPTRG